MKNNKVRGGGGGIKIMLIGRLSMSRVCLKVLNPILSPLCNFTYSNPAFLVELLLSDYENQGPDFKRNSPKAYHRKCPKE